MFLDERGRHAPGQQIKPVRVSKTARNTRVGLEHADQSKRADPLGHHRNLEDSIAAGTFRSDLYHRLKVVTIRLPTLRERGQDIRC